MDDPNGGRRNTGCPQGRQGHRSPDRDLGGRASRRRGIALALLTTEHQPGELTYVVNSARPPSPLPENRGFWQGNFRGPLDSYAGGFRFESIGQFLGMLCMDAMEEERQEKTAAFEREHGR